ncbi:MAG: SMC-Scp complex subunit ScpB [Candidatus Micrarchaeota archaeon]
MSGTKVHVYVKPKSGETPGFGGVIRTSAKGEIIKPRKKKEEKEFAVDELKALVSKVVGGEERAAEESLEADGLSPEGDDSKACDDMAEVLEAQDANFGRAKITGAAENGLNSRDVAGGETKDLDAQGGQSGHDGGGEGDLSSGAAGEKIVHASMSLGAHVHELHKLQNDFGAVLSGFETKVELVEKKEKKVEDLQIALDPYIRQNEPLRVLEAALFMAGQGLDNASLGKVVGIASISSVQKMMGELCGQYKQAGSAIEIMQDLDKKWYMRVRSSYAPAVKQFAGEAEISKHALKTLAYVSKNNGVTKRNLFKRLGGTIYEDVSELEQKGFVLTSPFGRTKKVHLTEKFRQYFEI